MSTTRREAGFTLIELLLVMVISIVVFGATLTAWLSVVHSNTAADRQRDNVETARQAMDRAARQLRNLANPTVNAVKTIDRATDYDFIFQTSDPAKTWVRYCLDTSAGTSRGVLWENESPASTVNITTNMRLACPGKDWATSRQVVTGVTNQTGGIDRNIFTFHCAVGAAATCPVDDTEYSKITTVGIDMWIDAVPGDRASEMHVSSGVFLRNQNEAPTASFRYGPLGSRRVLMNAGGSSDPEGRTLEYFWFDKDPTTLPELKTTSCSASFPSAVWQGVTFNKFFPTGVASPQTYYLVVRDPGCLISTTSLPVTIPG
jgi:prepilin-type N-terminal cleavage/methylation domain-containing protein